MPSEDHLDSPRKARAQRIIVESDARKELAKKVPAIDKKTARQIRAKGNFAAGDNN